MKASSAVLPVFLLLVATVLGKPKCNTPGELHPNTENCRKYYKCSNGEPTNQDCPGSLIFDVVLKICNWPDSTTCIVDLLPKKKKKRVKNEDDKSKVVTARNFLANPLPDDGVPTVPTARPRTRTRTRTRTSSSSSSRSSSSSSSLRGTSDSSSRSSSTSDRRNRVRPSIFEPKNRSSFISRFRPGRPKDESKDEIRGALGNRGDIRGDPIEDDYNQGDIRGDDPIQGDIRGDPVDDDYPGFFDPAPVKKKPKSKPVRCTTGASNELYANPRNCRKYYKCQGGTPSLQSCPANLVFDRNLKICNWPESVDCIEDPDAELPEVASSDRHPPKLKDPATNSVFVDVDEDFDDIPLFRAPSPDHKTVPSRAQALRKEEELTDNPMFRSIFETVRTLPNDEVDKIRPGRDENPENVKRVEFVLTQESYEDLFPRRHKSYTYTRFLQAFGKFPAICSYRGTEEKSDFICRKTLATMFAHFTQETGNHNPSDKEYEEWRQGLHVVREQNCLETGTGCEYNSNCEDEDSITKKWACGKDRTGKFRKYFGRGAKQLSYNFNYGQFSQAMFGDGRLLLDFPKFVADTWLNLASATWFYSYPQPPKPSMLHVIDGTWVPNNEDKRNGIEPGFGATINIINGGLECNTKDGRESKQATNRIAYYKKFAWYLYVDYDNEQLGCANQKQFTASGAGALPIYWDKDWQHPYQCKLVSYQTAYSSLQPGEYIGCVEENFKVVLFS